DIDDRLLGACPELLHGLPGLIAELTVGLALEAVEPPELDLRLPDLLARIGAQCRRCIGCWRLAWLGSLSTRVRRILREPDGTRIIRARGQRGECNRNRNRSGPPDTAKHPSPP